MNALELIFPFLVHPVVFLTGMRRPCRDQNADDNVDDDDDRGARARCCNIQPYRSPVETWPVQVTQTKQRKDGEKKWANVKTIIITINIL